MEQRTSTGNELGEGERIASTPTQWTLHGLSEWMPRVDNDPRFCWTAMSHVTLQVLDMQVHQLFHHSLKGRRKQHPRFTRLIRRKRGYTTKIWRIWHMKIWTLPRHLRCKDLCHRKTVPLQADAGIQVILIGLTFALKKARFKMFKFRCYSPWRTLVKMPGPDI